MTLQPWGDKTLVIYWIIWERWKTSMHVNRKSYIISSAYLKIKTSTITSPESTNPITTIIVIIIYYQQHQKKSYGSFLQKGFKILRLQSHYEETVYI